MAAGVTVALVRGECQGSLAGDQFTGAQLDFIVADECPPMGNPVCAADPNHLDLSRVAMGEFTKNGQPMPANSGTLNQRQMHWQFVN